jgi:hypothetical protein
MSKDRDLNLGERAFFNALRELTATNASLLKGARVAVKRNAAGDLVFAVVVPSERPAVVH